MTKNVKRLDKVSYEEMIEMASQGAKVLQTASVESAMKHDVDVNVRSTFNPKDMGTKISNDIESDNQAVTGVAYSKDEAKITLIDVEDKPGVAAEIFNKLAESSVNVDMIVQNNFIERKMTNLTFTVPMIELERSIKLLNDLKQKIEIVFQQIKERYNTSVPDKLIVDDSDDELAYQVEKIQRSLENIGPVNMAVQDEYNEDNERLNHLRKQRDDLVLSEENLRDTIQKIDRIARKKFQETFKHISKNYEKLFNLFFEGGYGNLRLVGEPDPLEADIIIDAQPPGKRNTSLRLLSSGEKALTAISLLFAIYQVKPSPYCILDEVDAPLDDVNIHKFTKVLKQFSDETQFIIVTHNKLTIEASDYLYGVTQQQKGISKIVTTL